MIPIRFYWFEAPWDRCWFLSKPKIRQKAKLKKNHSPFRWSPDSIFEPCDSHFSTDGSSDMFDRRFSEVYRLVNQKRMSGLPIGNLISFQAPIIGGQCPLILDPKEMMLQPMFLEEVDGKQRRWIFVRNQRSGSKGILKRLRLVSCSAYDVSVIGYRPQKGFFPCLIL